MLSPPLSLCELTKIGISQSENHATRPNSQFRGGAGNEHTTTRKLELHAVADMERQLFYKNPKVVPSCKNRQAVLLSSLGSDLLSLCNEPSISLKNVVDSLAPVMWACLLSLACIGFWTLCFPSGLALFFLGCFMVALLDTHVLLC